MKITEIEIYKLNIALREPFVISIGKYESATNILIKIKTDENHVGFGECSPLVNLVGETQETEYEVAKKLSAVIKGKNPLAIEDRLADLEKAIPGNTTIKSAFDMALYDIASKEAGMPLYKFLGGSNSREILTDMTVSIDTPNKMSADALKFKEEGFPSIKLKLGGGYPEDVERVKAVRSVIGYDLPLRIDANQGWDTITAIKVLKALEKYDIDHCEEPVPKWNNKALKTVKDNSPIAIMADESVFDHKDAFRVVAMEACDYINIKLSKSGGINCALKIIAISEGAGLKTQVGCMLESRLGLTALTHLVAARNNIVHFDIDSSLMHSEDPVVGGIKYVGNGEWKLPETPGLGAEIPQDFLDKMEMTVI
ncbi:MAG: dipeptide epimerase [Ichthyobacteriaceae bacterium]|nr:dipeptide epimerase [Ichthyobacteriaceae bacterium]